MLRNIAGLRFLVPRMFLVENGYFGNPDPEVNSLHKLLVIAFRDFKSFQKERGVYCSQTKFLPNFAARLHSATGRRYNLSP